MYFLTVTKNWGEILKSCTYGATEGQNGYGFDFCERESDELPLIVNCAGLYHAEASFSTDKREGRCDWYLLIVTGGELELHLTDGDRVAEVGTAVLFPPRFRYRYSGCAEKNTEYLWVHFTGSFVERLLTDFGVSSVDATVTEFVPVPEIKRLFERLFESFVTHDSAMPHRLGALVYEISVSVFGKTAVEEKASANLLSKSIRYIHSAFDSKISVPDLAKIEHLSVSRYNTLFRRVTGINPTGYILNLRIHTACELLQNTALSVGEIAESAGYEDARLFGKLFKREVGLTPTEYRKSGGKSRSR